MSTLNLIIGYSTAYSSGAESQFGRITFVFLGLGIMNFESRAEVEGFDRVDKTFSVLPGIRTWPSVPSVFYRYRRTWNRHAPVVGFEPCEEPSRDANCLSP
jgi:hypothetical protein